MKNSSINIVQRAVAEFARRRGVKPHGAQKAFAEACGVTRQTVRNWCLTNSVPVSRTPLVSQLTGFPPNTLNQGVRQMFEVPENSN